MGVGRRRPCTQCFFSAWRPRRSPDLLMPFLSTNPQRRSAIAEQAVFIRSRSYPCWEWHRIHNAPITVLGLNISPVRVVVMVHFSCFAIPVFIHEWVLTRHVAPPTIKEPSTSDALCECPAPKRAGQLRIRGSGPGQLRDLDPCGLLQQRIRNHDGGGSRRNIEGNVAPRLVARQNLA